jgi:light-regulated signal transduction histidine kinase (bacteriophytochrome)
VEDEKEKFLYYESIAEDSSERRNRETELANAVSAPASPQSEESFELVSKEAVDFIMQATERMKILIDDILAFSQYELSPL